MFLISSHNWPNEEFKTWGTSQFELQMHFKYFFSEFNQEKKLWFYLKLEQYLVILSYEEKGPNYCRELQTKV